jgi:hypothetical protein
LALGGVDFSVDTFSLTSIMNESNSLSIPPNYQNALAQTADHYNAMVMFVKLQMQRDIDYGIIPGTRLLTLLVLMRNYFIQ